jgi:hypothetical protein
MDDQTMKSPPEADQYSEAETARRRDATVKAMIATPPEPRATKPNRKLSRAKGASAKRGKAG